MEKKYYYPHSWQLLFLALSLSCSNIQADHSDPYVVQGIATVENVDAKTSLVRVSDATFLYWDDFSVDEDELIEFCQPSSSSVVVIEVDGKEPSTLLGTLKSNGNLFLINPNGILIGETGYIDTYGFLATTLPACPCPLIDGEFDVFIQGNSISSIINNGRIKAWDKDVYLIGYQIENKGVIDAAQGTVAICAGRETILNQSNGQKIGTFPSPIKYENEETGIDNSGVIVACRAELKADGNAYAIGIRHAGFINVTGSEHQAAEVCLATEKGDDIITGFISAENTDGTGGSIQILGEHIFLFENSRIDVSGDKGGGKILIGGDSGGNNPDVANAKMTFIDEGVSIFADALDDGNGGKVIVWAEEETRFFGAISSRGGENSGDGGRIEIAGKLSLEFQGQIDRLGPKGKEGTLLLNSISL